MKKSSEKRRRKRSTWTFQPDDDVREMVERLFGKEPSYGQKTQIVNESIRQKHAAAALSLAEQEVKAAQAKLDALKDKVSGKG